MATKRLICDSCGAPLKGLEQGRANIQCDYCATVIRVVGEGAEQYNTENIVNQILELGIARMRKDDFDKSFERAKDLIQQHKYAEANNVLNEILDSDETQSRAWYYKSLLPVLEQESVVFRGCYINIPVLAKINKRDQIAEYLTSCGLSWYQQRAFMKFYGSTDFLYEQQLRFLDKAIEYASTPDRKDFFTKQKSIAIARQRRKLRNRRIGNFFLIVLLIGTVAVGLVVLREVLVDNLR